MLTCEQQHAGVLRAAMHEHMNRRTGTARMMRVERVVVALLLLVSQGARLAVIAMPGERPKGLENPAGSHRPSPGSPTDERRKRKQHGWVHRLERVTATGRSPRVWVAMAEEVAMAMEVAMTE